MTRSLSAVCCIAGGGPAGMMLGYLLARAGVPVVVLEKHADFLRDFRGDTVHPSTLQVMHELGLLDEFLKLPHQEVRELSLQIGAERFKVADFSRLPTACKFVALMPQWDLLDFLASKGRELPTFTLVMQAEVEGLIEAGGKVLGVMARTPDGPLEVRADLTVGADGRHSAVRAAAGLPVQDVGAPMDVLWFRLPRQSTDDDDTFGHVEPGRLLVMLNRGDYWQCAYVIPKNGHERVRAEGLEAFQADVRRLSPFLGERVSELDDWEKIKLLTVSIDRLTQWSRPGLICIGDAAHAMSPIGGVGINLAIQDAVAAANILAGPLKTGHVAAADLAAVQKRRMFPTRATQGAQSLIQKRIIAPLLGAKGSLPIPLPVRLLNRFRLLRGIPARLVGIGVRPEHVRTPAV
ncbi:2-polyprenyl-6-methoxyphenol hydroxylase-like FAD-dependent oxidoreductase [Caulobacter ginsengisoli]|uniref:2-polyprenyl-6-methoxyphenol hydroxylase-like FAD-dependent oxidoreductase n=1 Tax=Caulobacter ginsengisoli TaxID=400775 RepID=A0ABU0IU95_9CAUL|nr:FAD-dependent oxidoreductase [Caulobacter ginsengisoli]MDQ0464537.1 2-polyprenyl-6-methoxyphenol hydroxylase-like FAD-dependent oxidoreductase [Caulobacter ginsengisoli]